MKSELEIPKSYTHVILAMLVYNFMHILAWELPLAVKHDWQINIYGAAVILIISALSMFFISIKKNWDFI